MNSAPRTAELASLVLARLLIPPLPLGLSTLRSKRLFRLALLNSFEQVAGEGDAFGVLIDTAPVSLIREIQNMS